MAEYESIKYAPAILPDSVYWPNDIHHTFAEDFDFLIKPSPSDTTGSTRVVTVLCCTRRHGESRWPLQLAFKIRYARSLGNAEIVVYTWVISFH